LTFALEICNYFSDVSKFITSMVEVDNVTLWNVYTFKRSRGWGRDARVLDEAHPVNRT
jgi:hypothetical protein